MLSRRLILAAVSLVLATGCSIELQHDLTEEDANAIYVLLNQNGISATKSKEEGGNEVRYLVTVPKADASAAFTLIKEHSLPRPQQSGFADIRKGKGMIPTQVEERAIMLEALGGEVSSALNKVDGVLEARTIVMLPEKNDLAQPDKQPLPSASVFIKFRTSLDGRAPIEEMVVKKFVSGAVENLTPENVTVIMSQSQPPESMGDGSAQIQNVLGIGVAKASAGTFKAMVAIGGLVMLLMAMLTGWTFMRGSSPAPPRPKRTA
ncbi:MAG: type III secretion protein [Myxococcota bacterium]|nr:type III secretion protein [Myxococcota bacterium]